MVEERQAALKQMIPHKVTGSDDVAVGLWKSQCWRSADRLTRFFNQIVGEKRVPSDWQQSTTISIWKRKGSPADRANYRPNRLLSHTMKVSEHFIDRRIRNIMRLSTNQSGFVAGCGTIVAIHAARLLVEKHREKQKPLHLAFLDLGKAFNRVPHKVIWYAFRQQGVPEELIEWIRIRYSSLRSHVQAAAGTSADFPISVSVREGSALSPLLFIVVMDVVTWDLQKITWTLLYADDAHLRRQAKTRAADTKLESPACKVQC
ncbi:hypothetical protein Y032_0029g1897 [Ancylostoma ceylanicum]|uniref:Reverse transcriptase domain-containing protein n=1 Tax=Ancylostoma ceylanicum TaxID=53326 RepID=A0A016UQZ4_9BILA|nr:hypothetical protein Y032_0029g1897 [Ancylostoma ceylanicum]